MTWIKHLDKTNLRYSLASVLLFVLAFPPSPLGFLAYFAIIPFLLICLRKTPVVALRTGYVIGTFISIIFFYYVIPYSLFDFGVLIILNAIPFSLFGFLQSYFIRLDQIFGLILFPFLWTGLEYLRQFGDFAFTWLSLAYTQTYYLPLIQISDVTGYLGITFWICSVNLLLLMVWRYRTNIRIALIPISIILTGFCLLLIYGSIKIQAQEFTEGIHVAYVQPDFETRHVWDKESVDINVDILLDYNLSIIEAEPDLIIWPETSVPYIIRSDSFLVSQIVSHTKHLKYSLMFGTQDLSINESDSLRHNCVMLISQGSEELQSYHKMRLVPGEEGLPFRALFSFFNMKGILKKYLTPGSDVNILSLTLPASRIKRDKNDWYEKSGEGSATEVRIGALICYESIFPEPAREYRNRGCQLLVVVTNDAWFGYSLQPFQHLQTAVYRAIENRISVIQSANSGVSGFIDPAGRISGQSGIFTREMRSSFLPLSTKNTFYAKIGDWPGIIAIILVLFFYIYFQVRQRRDIH